MIRQDSQPRSAPQPIAGDARVAGAQGSTPAASSGGVARDPSAAARARQVELILERVDSMPTLPAVAAKVIQLGASDSVEIEELASLIESDPALTTRILGLCKRADKGLGDRIVSVKRAVVMLGLEAVRSAVLSVSVFDALKPVDESRQRVIEREAGADQTDSGPSFDRVGFWKYSIAVACASELIASRLAKSAPRSHVRVMPEEAFLCGLLHAIGRVTLQWLLPNAYTRAVSLANTRGVSLASIERQLLGLDYRTAGKRLAGRWELPESVQDCIWLHGQGSAALSASPHADLIAIVSAGQALARATHLGFSGDGDTPVDAARVLREAGIDASDIEVTGLLHERVAERAQLLGLDDVDGPALLLESLTQATARLHNLHTRSQSRSLLATSQTRVLDAVATFHEQAAKGRGRTSVIEALARSATTLMGHGYYSLLVQGRDDDADQPTMSLSLYQFDHQGRVAGVRAVEPPATLQRQFSVASLSGDQAMSISGLALMPWLGDDLVDAPDLRTLKLLGLPGESTATFEGAAVITDRAATGQSGEFAGYGSPEAPIDRALLKPLLHAWSAGLRHAFDRDHAQRLQEQLVEAGRALSEAQQQLAQTEAMVRLGETTAGAAHEMNTPLAVINGRAQILLSRARDARDRAALQAISEASGQVSDLVENLHLLSKRPTANDRRCDLPETIRAAVERATQQISANADVSLELSRVPSVASIDTELFGGAIVELVCNALEAAPRGPVLITGLVDPAEGALIVRVSDNGPGLSDKAKAHAFDPFFSERGAGRGKGLGLTRAKLFAESLGGTITLISPIPGAPNKGGTIATLAVRRWAALEQPVKR
jgi:signal transduction histidine kinase/HD-like signal output (HDOD) protein